MQKIIDTHGMPVSAGTDWIQSQIDDGWRVVHLATLPNDSMTMSVLVAVLERDDDPVA